MQYTFPKGSWVYVNFGGMGLSINPQGKLDGVLGNESKLLRVVDASNSKEIYSGHRVGGWTEDALIKKLTELGPQIKESGWADAYLGETWLGSTEM